MVVSLQQGASPLLKEPPCKIPIFAPSSGQRQAKELYTLPLPSGGLLGCELLFQTNIYLSIYLSKIKILNLLLCISGTRDYFSRVPKRILQHIFQLFSPRKIAKRVFLTIFYFQKGLRV